MNTLYYGDNLNILRDYIKDESVDLGVRLNLYSVEAIRRQLDRHPVCGKA